MPYATEYIPLKLNDHVKGKVEYEIVQKLGWGAGSSIWLDSIAIYEGKLYELDALRALKNSDHPGHVYCIAPIELFAANSMHGAHLCIAFQLHSLSLQELLMQASNAGPGFRLSILAVQNIIVLTCLHSLQFVHTGNTIFPSHNIQMLSYSDIKASNIFIANIGEGRMIDKFVKAYPSQTYTPHYAMELSPDPIIMVVSQPLPPFECLTLNELQVWLADFGEAIHIDKMSERPLVMPVILQAPKIILGHPWGYAADIWAVSCMTMELLVTGPIFQLDTLPNIGLNEVHLACIIELLGQFDPTFLSKCSKRNAYFDETGQLLKTLNFEDGSISASGSLAHCLLTSIFEGQDLGSANDFLKCCLTLDPSLRPSAKELLEDPWLVSRQV
ncbi:Dual specificity tyrosine-phosphorylation-regulated kinase 4 [Leucoagaricus sp. SymC.cos]|nr:Dual specificity tyrosine-phosphorylation-regulated kinase 4 [Leucoagaricus sp. SymC.cos]